MRGFVDFKPKFQYIYVNILYHKELKILQLKIFKYKFNFWFEGLFFLVFLLMLFFNQANFLSFLVFYF